MTPQLDTVVIEVALRLRGNLQRLCRAKHLPSQNWTYGDIGFYSGHSSYLSMKVLTFEKFRIVLNLNYDKKNVDTSVTAQTSS